MKRRANKQPAVAAQTASAPKYLIPARLLALTLLAYLPALGGTFIWDDEFAIEKNPLRIGWDGLWAIWTTHGRIPMESHWWPLTYTVLWIEHQFWGLRPIGYHLVNILLHAAIVIQIWLLLRRLSVPGAGWAAAFFAVHPVHVEAVAWIVSIKDLLAVAFYLLAVGCFLNHIDRRSKTALPLAVLATLAAMLCKSVAVTLPAGLAILLWYRRDRWNRRTLGALIPIACVTLALAVIDIVATRHAATGSISPPPAMPDRIAQTGWALWFYLGKLLWPHPLTGLYPQWDIDAARPLHWLPILPAIALVIGLWLRRERWGRGPFACAVFYILTLAPMLGLIHFDFLDKAPAADRYQYLASLGPLVGFGSLIGRSFERSGSATRHKWLAFGALALLAVFSTLTWRQAGLYRSQPLFFHHTVRINPDSASAWLNLGNGLIRERRWNEAREALMRAVQLDPRSPRARANLAVVLVNENRPEEAAQTLETAIRLDPDYVAALNNLAVIRMREARWTDALELLERSVRLNPDEANAQGNLGAVLMRLNRHDEARRALETAIRLQPEYMDALENLGRLTIRQGDRPRGIEYLRRAAEAARRRGLLQQAAEYENLIRIYEEGAIP
jgi:Flp pilus assembly protein TadD